MKSGKLVFRSLRFYLRGHAGTMSGAAVATAALVGALAVGDSLRASLRERALRRLGWVQAALAPANRSFSCALTNLFSGYKRAAVIATRGTATLDVTGSRANHVAIYGIEGSFFSAQLGGGPQKDQIFLNEPLAQRLSAKVGDEILLRVPKPSALSREIAVTPHHEETMGLRFSVARILSASELGDFSLQANQIPPENAFVNGDVLASRLGLTNEANLLLLGESTDAKAPQIDGLQRELSKVKNASDFGIDLRVLSNSAQVELRSKRIFLEPEVERAAMAIESGEMRATPVLTYLANIIVNGTNATPYSMVAAAGPPLTPIHLADNEILISSWLADDLQTRVGDSLAIVYFDPESGAQLVERTNEFKVRSVVPAELPWADKTLMPDFPGIQNAESTSDWDGGFPLVYKIRPKDEDYWKKYRGTPKAFISLAAGQKLWRNRFGNVTAIRWGEKDGRQVLQDKTTIETELMSRIDPKALGLQFEPVKAQALRAAENSQDFGQLFVGFSLFLICAALMLMALLFRFSVDSRSAETGTLLATGWTGRQVRWLLMAEGGLVALTGVLFGIVPGLGYAKVMILALTTIWRGATNTSSLAFSVTPLSLATGVAGSVVVGVGTIWLTIRRQAKEPPTELLAGMVKPRRPGTGWLALSFGGLAGAGALAIAGWGIAKGETQDAETFFSSGILFLIALLGVLAGLLGRIAHPRESSGLSSNSLALRGTARRRNRSVAAVALLASGCFVVSAISIFRQDATAGSRDPRSGTGGFALLGESTLAIVQDLNTRSGKEAVGLDPRQLNNVQFVQGRVRSGDEASCLNLNEAQRPRLVGVDPQTLAGRFTFSSVMKGLEAAEGWKLLRTPNYVSSAAPGSEEISAFGDANSIQWALHKKIGDVIEYPGEDGRVLRLKLVAALENSILQGSLLIDEQAFRKYFPNESGYRLFMIDCPPGSEAGVAATLSRAFQDVGLELTPATRRLNQFNAVQNTYLSTFQLLGGIGLLLGSAGLGVIVLRNVLERRGELGLLTVVGLTRRQIHGLVLREHFALLLLGVLTGLAAALVAILPALLSANRRVAVFSLGITLVAVLANGIFWTWLATNRALRGELMTALRNE